jgi:hypothetical protein
MRRPQSRAAILKRLASQAAISLENIWLCAEPEEGEAKLRRHVDVSIMGV